MKTKVPVSVTSALLLAVFVSLSLAWAQFADLDGSSQFPIDRNRATLPEGNDDDDDDDDDDATSSMDVLTGVLSCRYFGSETALVDDGARLWFHATGEVLANDMQVGRPLGNEDLCYPVATALLARAQELGCTTSPLALSQREFGFVCTGDRSELVRRIEELSTELMTAGL